MIKYFLKKNKKKIISVLLMLLMWAMGFFCAWKVQGIKIGQYRAIIIQIAGLLENWEQRIEKLEREREEREKEEERIEGWNDLIED